MLTRVENYSVTFISHFLSFHGHVRVRIGKTYWDLKQSQFTKSEFEQLLHESQITPLRLRLNKNIYWLFEDKLYKDNEGLTHEDVKALLISRKKLQQSRINRAKTIAASPMSNNGERTSRTAIPDDVRLLVWQRDQGMCVRCGSTTELQYDHIIPFSLGGASTPENLQILCGRCNRAKSNSII